MTGNHALSVNGFTNTVTTNNHITVDGSDWYWTVTAVMACATAVFMGLSFTRSRSHRVFHYITASITLIASIAYFSMASNLGWTAIAVEFPRRQANVAGNMRQIFYVRYIDWFLTTPLLLTDLLLTAGLPYPTIFYTILMNEIMVVTGLVGALVKSSYKWGFYTFGCAAFLFVAWTVVFEGRSYAKVLGSDIAKSYTLCGVWTISLWFLYPIAWGLCEGGNVITSDSEAIFYGILDILAKPGFGALLLWGHRNIDPARLGLHVRDPMETRNTTNGGGNYHEKRDTTTNTNGYGADTNGTDGVTGAGITSGSAPTDTGVTPVHNAATTSV